MRNESAIVELDGVTAGYGGQSVLRGLSLRVNAGEFLGIVGPNGSGKSTLLRVMTGLLPPDGGEVLFSGIPMSRLSGKELARSFGAVFLHRESLPSFTAEEYVRQRLFARGIRSGMEESTIVRRTLGTAGVAHLAKRNIRTLSAGELQLVSIAGALAQNGELLFLDEPTAHLDIQHSLETAALLSRLHAGGATVVAVFHDINLALSCCTRIAGIKGGAAACDMAPASFAETDAAGELFDVSSSHGKDPFSGKPVLHFARR